MGGCTARWGSSQLNYATGGGGGVNSNDTVLLFGAGQVGSTTTIRFLYPGYDDMLAQTAGGGGTPISMVAPYSGTLRNLYVRHNIPAGNGNVIVYTVRVNGVASALSVFLGSLVAQGVNVANAVAVNAGDRIDIQISKAATVAVSPQDVTATLDLKVA